MLTTPHARPIKNEIWPRLAVLAQSNRILNTDSEPALTSRNEEVQKDVADIGVPGADRLHVSNNALK